MHKDDCNISQIANIAILAAINVGDLLKKGFYSDFDIIEKTSKFDLVTEYDRKAEEIIFSMVTELFPKHGFYGEEFGKRGNLESPYIWVVDPIDGTYNFAKQIPSFATSIACTYNHETIVGVCYDPLTDELFTAEKGKGAFMNGRKLQVSKTQTLDQSCFSLGMTTMIRSMDFLAVNRRSGSTVLDMCYVAKGSLDAYVEHELNPWDYAAAMLIVSEASGIVTDLKGQRINCAKKHSVLASNPHIHKGIVDWLSTEKI